MTFPRPAARLPLLTFLTLAVALPALPALADTAVVQRNLLGLRAEPAADAALVDRVKLNERLEILERRNSWLRVTTGVSTGWIPSGLVRVEETAAPAPRLDRLRGDERLVVVSGPTRHDARSRPRADRPLPLATVMQDPTRFRAGGPWHVEGHVATMDAINEELLLIDAGGARIFVALSQLSENARIGLAIALVRGDRVGITFRGVEPAGRLRATALHAGGETVR